MLKIKSKKELPACGKDRLPFLTDTCVAKLFDLCREEKGFGDLAELSKSDRLSKILNAPICFPHVISQGGRGAIR